MAGVPGKNKIEKGFRILIDDSGGVARDLTGDLIPGSLQGGGVTLDKVDMTGVSDAVKTALGGQGQAPITAQFHMNNTETTGAFTVLKDILGDAVTVTLQFGSLGAAPDTGDPEWEGEYVLLQNSINLSGGRGIITAMFEPMAGESAPAWGTVA